ncbi:trypsin-5-like [Cydia fagiglandana]|uniref:trypsin-5-like n=1 Tax=Cydia fagiglandana TaxID=1458189 RepID=UPI002FEE5558
MRASLSYLLVFSALWHARAKLNSDEEEDSGEQTLGSGENSNRTEPPTLDENDNLEPGAQESSEGLGAAVARIYQHPYAASLMNNDTYVCSLVVLNTYWLITQSKCFSSEVIASYVSHRGLGNYSVRVGSSYNNKGGTLHKIQMMINNFDLKVTAVKLQAPIAFSSRVSAVRIPNPDEPVTLGFLATMIAWTPTGHMRQVNAPVIEASICESYTKLMTGHYICVGGVKDPNRHFCRRDNGGAVIQNNTLIAVSSFLHTCALYSRSHAFPKVSSFARWLDSIIWDENNRPTTVQPTTTVQGVKKLNTTQSPIPENSDPRNIYQDPRKFLLTLPFDPIDVPLEPTGDNSVLPRMSLYESYLQNMARAKTSTTEDPMEIEEQARRMWLQKFGKNVVLPPGFLV